MNISEEARRRRVEKAGATRGHGGRRRGAERGAGPDRRAGDDLWTGAGDLRETVLVLDEPGPGGDRRRAGFLRRRGLHPDPADRLLGGLRRAGPGARGEPGRRAEGGDAGPARDWAARGDAPAGGGQVAAVPVQVKPEWCRVWVTVNGEGPAPRAPPGPTWRAHRDRGAGGACGAGDRAGGLRPEPAGPSTLRPCATLERQGLDEARSRTGWPATRCAGRPWGARSPARPTDPLGPLARPGSLTQGKGYFHLGAASPAPSGERRSELEASGGRCALRVRARRRPVRGPPGAPPAPFSAPAPPPRLPRPAPRAPPASPVTWT